MSVLRNLESRIADLVEGTFGRVFRTQVRPVEIARKLVKEMEEHKTISVSRTYVPNEYAVWLSPEDHERFDGVEHEVIDELSAYLLEHARREKLALVSRPAIEFQTDEHVAPIVAAKYREAGIPLIALEVPHPGATYFGANNYEAGLIGGRHLGRWAKQHWHADIDEIVLLALERAGSLPKMRLTGMLVGMKEVCPHLEHSRVTYLDGDGVLGDSFEAMRKHLRSARSRPPLPAVQARRSARERVLSTTSGLTHARRAWLIPQRT